MRYHFNLIKGTVWVEDSEGAEFESQEGARAEAEQVARDLAAEELLTGKPVPNDWAVELADADGKVLATVPFVSVMVAPSRQGQTLRPSGEQPRVHDNVQEQHRRTLHAIEASREARQQIRKNCSALWKLLPQFNDTVRELARLSEGKGDKAIG